MDQSSERKREILAALAVLVVIVIIVAGIAVAKDKQAKTDISTNVAPVTATSTTNMPASSQQMGMMKAYKDGSYSAVGTFNSPGGQEAITINITIKDGTVTGTSAISGSNDRESEEYEARFINGYKQHVVGKNVDSINLGRISGSSLTPIGFNDALEQIKAQAKA